MKRIAIIFMPMFLSVGLFAQSPEEIISKADFLLALEDYGQIISLLQKNKNTLLNTDTPDFGIYYNLYM